MLVETVQTPAWKAASYLSDEAINLSGAVPNSGWQIASWYGTSNNSSTDGVAIASSENATVANRPKLAVTYSTGSPTTPPTAPSVMNATIQQANQIHLTWTDNANNESGFELERSTTGIGGVQQADLTGVDNDTRRVDRARLEALSGVDNGTRGTCYFDVFESRRQNYVGP